MNRIVHLRFTNLVSLLLALLISVSTAQAQTTSFTYQGRFTDTLLGGNATNGTYDFQFRLFDAPTGGNQIGSPVDRNGVTVTNSAFSVQLDFGAAAFTGANRWLEIGARVPVAGGPYATLTPRQPVTSTPYAIKSLSAAAADNLSASCNGCVSGAQIGSLPTNSGNYIQNGAALQANSNFNISGNGLIGGRLGIGTTSPEYGLDIRGIGQIALTGPGDVFGRNGLSPHSGTGDFLFFAGAPGGGINRLTIKNGGNVGIGTAAPTDKLQISDFSSPETNAFLKIVTKGTNVGTPGDRIAGIKLKHFDDNYGFTLEALEGQTLAGFSIKSFVNSPTGITRFFIDEGNGNVGIGTTAPGSLLTLKASSNTAPALEINQGAIKVAGAGLGTTTPVFIHKASAQTISTSVCQGGNCTVIDHPLTNGDANAILIVTPNWNAGLAPGVYNNHAIGVFFTGVNWVIFNQDIAPMPVGAAFNVLVVKP